MIKNFKEMEKQAKDLPSKRVALAMAEEDDVLTAIVKAAEEDIVIPVLVGDEKKIKEIAKQEKLDLSKCSIVQASGEKECAEKAVELVRTGKADLLMKGKVATSSIMKAVLNKETGLRSDGVISHVSVIEAKLYHKLMFMTDAAMIPLPTIDEKIGLVNNAVAVAQKFGIKKPKVGVIGAVEKVNPGSMPATVDAAVLSKMAERGQIKNCIIDGPFALDNAISKKSCEVKGIESDVGGDADVLLMPDLAAANVMYKTVGYLTDLKMAGVIVGAKVPIILTSRADNEEVKYLSILTGVSLV